METLFQILSIIVGLAVVYWMLHTAPTDSRIQHYYSGPNDWDSGYDQ